MSSAFAEPWPHLADPDPVLTLTTRVATAFLAHNPVPPQGVGDLVSTVGRAFADLASQGPAHPVAGAGPPDRPRAPLVPPGPAMPMGPSRLTPVVDPRRSLFPDHLFCIECGRRLISLTRHLNEIHGLTPHRYRRRWNLTDAYPMVARTYADSRAAIAKAAGLGGPPKTRS